MRTLTCLLALALCAVPALAQKDKDKKDPKVVQPTGTPSKQPAILAPLGEAAGKLTVGPLGEKGKKADAVKDSLRRLPGFRAARGGTNFISPDESWSCALEGAWQAHETEQAGLIALAPAGTPPQTSTRMMFVLAGQLSPEEAANPDTTLLQAVANAFVGQVTQNYGLNLVAKGPAAAAQFGARKGAAVEYSATLAQNNTTVGLWGGMTREEGKCIIVSAFARGDEFAPTQKTAMGILETAKPYQAPRSPETERAIVGKWSGILSVKTGSTSSSSSTVTYQFNGDGTFWRRFTHSYSSSGGVGSLSGASDNFDQGAYAVHGKHLILKLRQGGELRLKLEGNGRGGLKIGGTEVVRGEA